MIDQQELQHLLDLPDQEKLSLAYRLLESVVAKTNGQLTEAAVQPEPAESAEQSDEPSPSAKWLLSMAGIFSGGPGDTGERADEICAAEIKRRSGFTLKEELPE
jgi:hypothetical protein